MAILTKPSQLSLETATIIFGFVVTLAFGFSLFIIASERIEEFIDYHQSISSATTTNIGNEVERVLLQKKKLVNTFLEDNKALVANLAAHPHSMELNTRLSKKLARYFPDYYFSIITTDKGELIVDDVEGEIGTLCLLDSKPYIDTGEQLIRIHPDPKIYHYDILSEFTMGRKKMLFFVSFNTNDIASLLRTSAPDNHNMLIINSVDNLVEISSTGSGDKLQGRIDFQLTDDEMRRTLSTFKVPGTYWKIIDVRKKGLFSDYRMRLLRQGTLIYAFFVALALFMSMSLLFGIRKQNKLQDFLVEKNKKINELNTELETLSLTDSLTGLYNRRYLDIYGPTEMSTARRLNIPLNIALIDIDFFKQYNDTYGHQAGDACLQQVTMIMANAFRRSNEMSARYGGEEFIIMNLGDDLNTFTTRLEQFSALIRARNIEHTNSEISSLITVSIGIATTADTSCRTVHELIGKADSALYLAKQNGRNQIVIAKGQ